jgi:oxygen-independent coproporphyrinogen-3 oxidase
VTTREHIDALVEVGFNRLSMGVQDFTPQVQQAIGRNQDEASTRALYAYCRQQGFESINIDLIYGLPRQTPEGFARNLQAVIELRPDRVALYSYAHVPWIKAHQKYIEVKMLPPREQKFALLLQAIRAFGEAGYRQIGMDHFALPTDELSRALEQRRLHRNFMGYTVQRTPQMIGLGISSIGFLGGAYVQNHKKLSTYYQALDAGVLPVERGYALSPDDQVRRHVITELMCNLYLDIAEVEGLFGISFAEYFARELEELEAGPAADGLVRLGEEQLEVTPLGQLFIRNICMPFDRYLREKPRARPTFSRTV